MSGCADTPEQGACVRPKDAPDDIPAMAPFRGRAFRNLHVKETSGVMKAVLIPDVHAAHRDRAEPPPARGPGLEDPLHRLTGGHVADLRHTPGVRVRDAGLAFFALTHDFCDSPEDIDRLKTSHRGRYMKGVGQESPCLPARHNAHVARAEDAVEGDLVGIHDCPHGRRRQLMHGQDGIVVQP